MASPAYNACATFPSSLQATCQLRRSCTTLASSVGFSLSMTSPAFSPFGFSTAYHFSPSSLSLSPTFLLLMSLSLYQNVSELVGHLDLGTGLLRRQIRHRCEALLPTGMMRIPPGGDVGLDAPFGTRGQGRGAKVASIQCCRLGRADLPGNGRQRRFGFLAIVRMIGQRPAHDEQTCLI